jgi:hypothetical protein
MSDFDDILTAEPQLKAIDRMVRTQILFIRNQDEFCAGCYWTHILKPLVRPLVGWERGYPPKQAKEKSAGLPVGLTLTSAREYLSNWPERPPAANGNEEFLRTSHAFDIVTDAWLKLLNDADPANGHGFKRAER